MLAPLNFWKSYACPSPQSLPTRYVRREKEIASTRRELAESENLRYKQQLESTQRQLTSTKEELKELYQSVSSQSATAAQHAELLKKVRHPLPHSHTHQQCAVLLLVIGLFQTISTQMVIFLHFVLKEALIRPQMSLPTILLSLATTSHTHLLLAVLTIFFKVENLNLLTDSNKLLREERDRHLTTIRELEATRERLEGEVGPLKEANRQLTAQKDALLAEKTALRY